MHCNPYFVKKKNVFFPACGRSSKVGRCGSILENSLIIPMARGFMFLVAVMDWYSRKVLSFKLSNTLDTDFCLEAVEEAIRLYGPPEIFNTDQGAQFTSRDFTGLLEQHQVRISMDGRGRVQDNIFIERVWWTTKYQYLYLRSFDNGSALSLGLEEWFRFYNQERPHQTEYVNENETPTVNN